MNNLTPQDYIFWILVGLGVLVAVYESLINETNLYPPPENKEPKIKPKKKKD